MTEVRDLQLTGIPGLDAVLDGGLSKHAFTLVIGVPGSGKTVLTSHILFHAAQQGVQTLIFTSYSEGNEQYIEHMDAFDFFDRSLLGTTVQLFSLQSQITGDDTSPAATITRIIRSTGAKLVLIDGFQGIAPLFREEQNLRTFLSTLAVQCRYLDVTLLITIAGNAHDSQLDAELTVADVIISLDYTVQGRRHQRLLEVIKQRGRAQLSGTHSYTITTTGVQVFPRIEIYPQRVVRSYPDTRAAFGLKELDTVLGGGPNTGTTTLLAGAPGVGKTTLGLYWALADARPDASTLFVTFSEYPEQLQRKAAAFGLDLQSALASGALHVLRVASSELDVDQFATVILTEIATGNVRRLVCDDIAILVHELGTRSRDYISALNDILHGLNLTSLYLLEIPPFGGFHLNLTNTPLAVLGDNVIIIQQHEADGILHRLLAVLRMRLSFFDRALRELILDESSIRVVVPQEQVLRSLEADTRLRRRGAQDQDGRTLEGI